MNGAPDIDIVVNDYPPARRAMRVAVVTETFPPEVNGVALTVARMVEGLRARDHAIQLVRLRQGARDAGLRGSAYEEVLLRGLPIPRYPHLKMGVPSTRALVALWTRQRPDVVHIATEGPLGWSALRAARRLRLPVVSDFRTNFHAYSRHYGVGWLQRPIVAYLRKFHNHTQRTMVPTEALRADLHALGFERLTVVARGVDTQLFSPACRSEALRSEWGAGPGTLVVACVGRIAAEKNLGLLWEAFGSVRDAGIDARLVIVGDGPAREDLQGRWNGAVFAGVRRGAELTAHFASADLFVFPSLSETFGNVITEAMASGLALVAYDHAAASALVRHGDNGLVAPCGDRVRFVDLVVQAAGNAAMRAALGRRALETAATLDWDRVIDDLEDVLQGVIPERDAAARSLGLHPEPDIGRVEYERNA